MAHKGGFKNLKLGKNVYRQMKRRGQQEYEPPRPPPTRSGTYPSDQLPGHQGPKPREPHKD